MFANVRCFWRVVRRDLGGHVTMVDPWESFFREKRYVLTQENGDCASYNPGTFEECTRMRTRRIRVILRMDFIFLYSINNS